MTHLQLSVNPNRIEADIFIRFRNTKDRDSVVVAIVDTGAQVTVLPLHYMNTAAYRLTPRGRVAVEQAGISRHSFEVIEAYMTVSLEDFNELRTTEFETIVWFTDTEKPLLGVEKMLDRAILHLDMPNLTGYLEFPT